MGDQKLRRAIIKIRYGLKWWYINVRKRNKQRKPKLSLLSRVLSTLLRKRDFDEQTLVIVEWKIKDGLWPHYFGVE